MFRWQKNRQSAKQMTLCMFNQWVFVFQCCSPGWTAPVFVWPQGSRTSSPWGNWWLLVWSSWSAWSRSSMVNLHRLWLKARVRPDGAKHKSLTCSLGNYEALTPQVAFSLDRTPSVGQIALAFLQASFAFSGWNFLNYVTEEVVEPRRWIYLCALKPPVSWTETAQHQCLKNSFFHFKRLWSTFMHVWLIFAFICAWPRSGIYLVPSTSPFHWWPLCTRSPTSPTSPPCPLRSCCHPMPWL